MGREIRRVPPNWEHPKGEGGEYLPMVDEDYASAAQEWLGNCMLWAQGCHPDQLKPDSPASQSPFYWQWTDDPPDAEYYRPAFTEEPTWYQMYETVSEGTPVTPPFDTKAELADYLVDCGTFWDKGKGWSREAADGFVGVGYAPSMIVGGGRIVTPRDAGMYDREKA